MSGTGVIQLGYNCYAYYNAGSFGSPTWTVIDPIRDLTLPLEDEDVDASSRGSLGWKETEPGMADGSVEWDMLYGQTDTAFAALQAAYNGRTTIQLLILDGPQSTAGSQGLNAIMKINKFARKEELKGAVMTELKASPAKNASAAPSWYTAA
jgi:hypothetical protein